MLSIYTAIEEHFQLLQWGIHGNDLVDSSLPPEFDHCLRNFIGLFYFAGLEEDAKMWYREVTQQGAVGGRDHGKMRVISFEGSEEGVGDGICRIAGEG